MSSHHITEHELSTICTELREKNAEEIVQWAVKRFYPKLLFATAFGAEGCCIIHMLAQFETRINIINLDTGYQFKETLELRERIREKYGIEVTLVQPKLTVEEYERVHGGPLYNHRPDQCCFDRKIVPLREAIVGHDAWISSIRGDQTKERASAQVVQWDAKFNLVKVNPLLKWNFKDVWGYIYKHQVPYNVLHDQNYPSIGCWPCTAPIEEGQGERDGRWKGTKKKECGLHVIEHQQGSGI